MVKYSGLKMDKPHKRNSKHHNTSNRHHNSSSHQEMLKDLLKLKEGLDNHNSKRQRLNLMMICLFDE
jgi:hypothetical protein